MTDFELFKQALDRYNCLTDVKNECEHLDIKDEGGVVLCLDCGEELKRELSFDKEWRYYGSEDTRRGTDPNRCQIRKLEDRSIYKDVENMGFGEKITNVANTIYTQATQGKIYRGNSRKSIIFACIFQSYKLIGKPQTYESLKSRFFKDQERLEQRNILKGLKFVNFNVPKDSEIRTKYITPAELIDEIMDKFNASIEQKSEVLSIYEKVKNRSSLLNRARPQSFASGLIYYWLVSKDPSVNIKDFVKKVNLSELTINKISKEISKILD
jgi:transcription initiation factor TFIIIB Brf1 subunit/transcription initiation factor TFIIB